MNTKANRVIIRVITGYTGIGLRLKGLVLMKTRVPVYYTHQPISSSLSERAPRQTFMCSCRSARGFGMPSLQQPIYRESGRLQYLRSLILRNSCWQLPYGSFPKYRDPNIAPHTMSLIIGTPQKGNPTAEALYGPGPVRETATSMGSV